MDIPLPGPTEGGTDLLARVFDALPMGLVCVHPGQDGITANRFVRDLLGLPPADLAPEIAPAQLERLGIQLKPIDQVAPGPGISSHVRIANRCYAVTSFALDGPGSRGIVWRIVELADAPISGAVRHEFNNLLGRVICLAEEIQEQHDLQEIYGRAETLIVTAERGAEAVRRLMADIENPADDAHAGHTESCLTCMASDDPMLDVQITGIELAPR